MAIKNFAPISRNWHSLTRKTSATFREQKSKPKYQNLQHTDKQVKKGKKRKGTLDTLAAKMAEVVLPEPPLPKKVTNFVGLSLSFWAMVTALFLEFLFTVLIEVSMPWNVEESGIIKLDDDNDNAEDNGERIGAVDKAISFSLHVRGT